MRRIQANVATGMNLYLALSKLDLILEFGESATPLPDAEHAAAIALSDLAYVTDFRAAAGAELCSELFTAKAVGELIVKMGVTEGIIVEDDVHGLGVRLHSALSPALAQMLESFNRCLGVVLVYLAGSYADALTSRSRVGPGRVLNQGVTGLSALCNMGGA